MPSPLRRVNKPNDGLSPTKRWNQAVMKPPAVRYESGTFLLSFFGQEPDGDDLDGEGLFVYLVVDSVVGDFPTEHSRQDFDSTGRVGAGHKGQVLNRKQGGFVVGERVKGVVAGLSAVLKAPEHGGLLSFRPGGVVVPHGRRRWRGRLPYGP